MKFLLLSDVHATSKNSTSRQDDVLQAFLGKFGFILKYAIKRGIPILQAGDFFDRPRDWYLLFKITIILLDIEVELNTVFGQHDTYLYSDREAIPTSLGILSKSGLFNLLGPKPKKYKDKVYVYGAGYGDPIPEPKGRFNILVIHAPICTYPLFPGHEYNDVEEVVDRNHGYDLILAGDIHRQFKYCQDDTMIINTGPMLRLDAVKYNFSHEPCFYIYDTVKKDAKKVIIPHSPAKDILSRAHIESKSHDDETLSQLVTSLKSISTPSKGGIINISEDIKMLVNKLRANKRTKQILSEVMSNAKTEGRKRRRRKN